MRDRATVLNKTIRFSPFFVPSPDRTNTDTPSAGNRYSWHQRSCVISRSRQSVLIANRTVRPKWSGNAANSARCSLQVIGRGLRVLIQEQLQ